MSGMVRLVALGALAAGLPAADVRAHYEAPWNEGGRYAVSDRVDLMLYQDGTATLAGRREKQIGSNALRWREGLMHLPGGRQTYGLTISRADGQTLYAFPYRDAVKTDLSCREMGLSVDLTLVAPAAVPVRERAPASEENTFRE